jgi:ribonucleoside-triphosphate reductase
MDRIDLQGQLDKHFSGGAICHVTTGERFTSELMMRNLIRHCASKGVVYWAVNYTLHRCVNGHMSVGDKLTVCPLCGEPIADTFTRVVGFLTNTKNWHKVRREEDFPKRVQYYTE